MCGVIIPNIGLRMKAIDGHWLCQVMWFVNLVLITRYPLCGDSDLDLNTCFNIDDDLLDHLCRSIETAEHN